MDARVSPILDALEACGREMRQHADWIESLLRMTYQMWTVAGQYEANVMSARAMREHADLMETRIATIEKQWLEPGEHARACGVGGCKPWCRFRDPVPVPAARAASEPAPAPEPKAEAPPQNRFALIEMD